MVGRELAGMNTPTKIIVALSAFAVLSGCCLKGEAKAKPPPKVYTQDQYAWISQCAMRLDGTHQISQCTDRLRKLEALKVIR